MSKTTNLIELVSQLGKRKSLHNEIFINNLFEEKNFLLEYKNVKIHSEDQSTLDGFVGQIEIPPKFTQTGFYTFLIKWIVANDQLFTTSKNQHFQ
ncbi:11787_t:CDS:2, partial [Funneliformis geosporum]